LQLYFYQSALVFLNLLQSIFQRVKVSYVRVEHPETLASRKLVVGNDRSEGSETAKVGTDEQKPDMRQGRVDKVAHHTDVQNLGN
jgi:hypothetical protein